MVHRIIAHDIFRFAVVFVFILLGFTAANISIFAYSPEGIPEQLTSFPIGLLSLFKLMIGLDEWNILDVARSYTAAACIFVLFVILTTILLLNMLIAAMTDTYASVRDQSEALRMRYIALTSLMLERRLMPFKICRDNHAKSYLHQYGADKQWAILVHEVLSEKQSKANGH